MYVVAFKMKSTGQKVSLLRHQTNCLVPLIFCIGSKDLYGFCWPCVQGVFKRIAVGELDCHDRWCMCWRILFNHTPEGFHCRMQTRSASIGQDGVANLKNRVRLFSRCRDALSYYFFDKARTQLLKITSLQDQTGRKPGIGPFAYLGPKHFPRSGYVEVLLGDHWPMVKPEPTQRQSDWEFHAMENYVADCKLILKSHSWGAKKHAESWCLGRSGKISIHQDFEWALTWK